jgi:hypothetical protein
MVWFRETEWNLRQDGWSLCQHLNPRPPWNPDDQNMNLCRCKNLKSSLCNFLHLPVTSFSLGIIVSIYEQLNMNYEIQVNLVHKIFADICMGYKQSCYKTFFLSFISIKSNTVQDVEKSVYKINSTRVLSQCSYNIK